MGDLFLLSERQMARIEAYFRYRTAYPGSMTGAL